MLFATRLRLSHFRFLALLVVITGLASSCQSSRPGYSFQPLPGRARTVPVALPAAVATEEPAATGATLTAASPKLRVGIRPEKPRRQPLRPAPATAAATVSTEAAQNKPVTRRRTLLRHPHATAEVGLGTTVLGVLGLVLLPIALIALLLGGGLVWGIVGGLAALAVLVAYLDPFGR